MIIILPVLQNVKIVWSKIISESKASEKGLKATTNKIEIKEKSKRNCCNQERDRVFVTVWQ